jgi:AcrR family transcriptional regulator
MAEIAKTAGMSVGHIYHYFESKEAIIIAIVQGQQEEVLALLDQVERSAAPLADALLDEAARGVDGCMDVASTALMLEVLAEAARNPKVAEVVQASDAVLRRRMREVLARAMGHADPVSVPGIEDRVESLFTLFQGIPVRAIRNPALDRERMVRIVRETIRWILHEPA